MRLSEWNTTTLTRMSTKMMSPTERNHITQMFVSDALVRPMMKFVPTLTTDHTTPLTTRLLPALLERLPMFSLEISTIPRGMTGILIV